MSGTIISLLALSIGFTALIAWVLLPGNKQRFADASALPFAEEAEQDHHE